MCALCRQALLSFSPAQRDEGLQLDEATGEVRLLCVIHAAALGVSVCPSGGLDLCSGLLVFLWLPGAGTCSSCQAAAWSCSGG